MRIPHWLGNILAPPPTGVDLERHAAAMNEAIETMNMVMAEQHAVLMGLLTEGRQTIPERQDGHSAPPSQAGVDLGHEITEQTAARAWLAQTTRAHHAELTARPPASPDDEQYDTEYRCEDCGKVLEGDDLNFDGDGITLCKFHYEYLLAETAAMSDEEYREMYENLFGWPEADEHSEVPDGPAGLDEDGAK